MSAIIDACGNDTGSPSMSKTEDNLSNSDGPLIRKSVHQNSTSSLRISSENVNGTTIITSRGSTPIDEKSTRKRYCLWTLTFFLAIISLCNLLLSITIITVLRINQGMEAMEMIPDENLVKFYGRTDLDRICLLSGICQSYGDEPMEITSDEAGITIIVNNKLNSETFQHSYFEILPNGTSISQVRLFEIKDFRTGAIYFSTDFPKFGLPSGVDRIDVKIAQTHRITSPVNESLGISSDDRISLHGAEGIKMESKDIVWSASNDVLLKSLNGSIIFDTKNGISIDIDNIPVAPMFVENPTDQEQYKVCVCMPQGKLFKVPVRAGANLRSANCARISRTPENDPCLR
ncbi:Beta-sarcoglycan [Vespula squamosa]|uniref:Beta-sarcoglycan n=1 Tax=Vespula squamosa TaxID=30214 RepID=A0ABD1ZVX2_VESSQ